MDAGTSSQEEEFDSDDEDYTNYDDNYNDEEGGGYVEDGLLSQGHPQAMHHLTQRMKRQLSAGRVGNQTKNIRLDF